MGALESPVLVVLALLGLLIPLALAAAIVEWLARRRGSTDAQRRRF